MGPLAAQVMLGTNKLLVRLRGRVHTYKAMPLIPTFQPSYLLKNPEMKKAAWVDLQLVQRELNR
jgi:DNA polymerase